MIRVQQLCGGGLHGDVPYWLDTLWCGVRVETAFRWLRGCGWGLYTVYKYCSFSAREYAVAEYAPMRLRLKGRSWIEDIVKPATLVAGTFSSVNGHHRAEQRKRDDIADAIDRLRRQSARRPRKRRGVLA